MRRSICISVCIVFCVAFSSCSENGNTAGIKETQPVLIDEDSCGLNGDLTYKSYGDACLLGSGSVWSISDLGEKIGLNEKNWKNSKMSLYTLNRMNGKETFVADYTGQDYIEDTVSEDGAYEIYLRVEGQEETFDLKKFVDIISVGSMVIDQDEMETGGVLELK